jgi:hypothetical protein
MAPVVNVSRKGAKNRSRKDMYPLRYLRYFLLCG